MRLLSYFELFLTFIIIYHLAYLKSCGCQLVINVKNQGGDIVQESITSNTSDDTITLEFQRPEGTLITQFIDFKSEVQIFRVLVLGEEERGQSQYQVLCFATQLSKNDFISADAMSKLRQRNPGAVRQPEEDRGKEILEMDLSIELEKSSVISPHLPYLCDEAAHFAYARESDLRAWASPKEFHIVVCGLDSIVARRWINGMLIGLNLEEMEQDGNLIPMIDGGTEGFKGNVRVMIPGMTACIDCTLDLYPPQVTFPLCTIAQTPRLPEHCIEYVKVLLWPKERNVSIDGDDPKHVRWIYERSLERAKEYNISGVTYRLTQGVIKNIIPAVASTNAVIAAACTTEVFKLATSAYNPLNNYMVFNDIDGIYTYTFEAEKKENCLACSQKVHTLTFSELDKLQDVINFLIENADYQMRSPALTTNLDGRNKTLYMSSVPSIEEATRPNLKKYLKELGIVDGQQIVVADATTPSSLIFKLNLTSKMES